MANSKKMKYSVNELNKLRRQVEELEKRELLRHEQEEQMSRFSAVVRDSTDAITVQKLDGTILYWNHAAELVYGWTPAEAIGKNISIIIPEDKRFEKDEMRNKLIKGDTAVSFETKRVAKGGRILDIWLTIGRSADKHGNINAISTIERDITQRKKAETALKDSEAKLREQKAVLEQKNVAFRELIEQIEIEKKLIKDQVSANVENLLLPLLKKIKMQSKNNKHIELLENNLKNMTSSFGIKVADVHLKLSPREIEICNMIKSGFTSKEISEALRISYKTTELHRNNIRRKLGIVNKRINLVVYLQQNLPTN